MRQLTLSCYLKSRPTIFQQLILVHRCSLAAMAQFYPKKYPDNFWVLVFCVGLYVAASLAHSALFSGIEGDVFFIAKQKVLHASHRQTYVLSQPTV